MKVPFLSLEEPYLEVQEQVEEAALGVLRSGRYILGERVAELEERLGETLVGPGAGYVVGCNSGTDALILAFKAAGVCADDEVVTVANTACPTVAAIRAVGATPVFTEIDPETWMMDAAGLEAAITEKTRAVVPVHLYGNAADVSRILEVIGGRDIAVVEDTAQAFGTSIDGRQAGTLGRFGAFSFYPTKNLGGFGDGGAVFCRDPGDRDALRQLRNYGLADRYSAERSGGINSRLDEIQAAILLAKLPFLPKWSARKAQLVDRYRANLESHASVRLPHVAPGIDPAWHLMTVRVAADDILRDDVLVALEARGVGCLVHYPKVLYRHEAFRRFERRRLEVTERLCRDILSLPLHPHLDDSQVDFVSRSLIDALEASRATGGDRHGSV